MATEHRATNIPLEVVSHRFIETNGLRMHLAEQGTGPLMLLCHGFPELWYSWRYQFPALVKAGYHVVVPDLRGYGQTDQPDAIEVYTLLHLVGDLVGVLDVLGEQQAILVGHDWGSTLAWHAALMRPDRFPALISMSVPYLPRGPLHGTRATVPPTQIWRQVWGDHFFYQSYFLQPGVAEAELERDYSPPAHAVPGRLVHAPATAPSSYPLAQPWHAAVPLLSRELPSKVRCIALWL